MHNFPLSLSCINEAYKLWCALFSRCISHLLYSNHFYPSLFTLDIGLYVIIAVRFNIATNCQPIRELCEMFIASFGILLIAYGYIAFLLILTVLHKRLFFRPLSARIQTTVLAWISNGKWDLYETTVYIAMQWYTFNTVLSVRMLYLDVVSAAAIIVKMLICATRTMWCAYFCCCTLFSVFVCMCAVWFFSFYFDSSGSFHTI